MEISREVVYRAIDSERKYQNEKWAGHSHEVGAYLTLLRSYINKAEEAWTSNKGDEEALDVVRKIAGISVHCMEEHGAPFRK